MKVYVTSTGSYSDYKVTGVFTSLDKASFASKLQGDDNDPQEFEVDVIVDHPEGMFWYRVRMDEFGHASSIRTERPPIENYLEWRPCGDNKNMYFYMWASDEKHAVKIANERRAQLIASNSWVTDYQYWWGNIKKETIKTIHQS